VFQFPDPLDNVNLEFVVFLVSDKEGKNSTECATVNYSLSESGALPENEERHAIAFCADDDLSRPLDPRSFISFEFIDVLNILDRQRTRERCSTPISSRTF
jgi:hypothetical protein